MDRDRMQAAIAEFLAATGIDLDDVHLSQTPARVTEAWADELLRGYDADIALLLADSTPATSHDAVVVTGIRFVSSCPHHLLPYTGIAHVAYCPGDKIAGFGHIVQIVQVLGARLVIQEALAQDVVAALMEHLGAEGAACVLEAQQACMTVRGVKAHESQVRCSAWAGTFESSNVAADGLRRELLDAIAAWHAPGLASIPATR